MSEMFLSRLKDDLTSLTNLSEDIEPILTELWLAEEEGNLCIPVKEEWKHLLKKNPVGLVQEKIKGETFLFFSKTHSTKSVLETHLKQRIRHAETKQSSEQIPDFQSLLEDLERNSFQLKEGQKEAVLTSLRSDFQIISGGPGTGKTTVVAFILEILYRLGKLPSSDQLALVAPTGRAAQRLTESIQENLSKIAGLREENRFLRGQTIHNLLSYKPQLNGFYYNQERYLPHKMILVDEVSMVDADLMRSLLEALPPLSHDLKLILIGDPNQLPSVEKGAVLGDFLTALKNKKGFVSHLTESNRQKPNANGKVSRIVSLAEEILSSSEPKYETKSKNKKEINQPDLFAPKEDNEEIKSVSALGESFPYPSEVVWFNLELNQVKLNSFQEREKIVYHIWKKFLYPQIIRISGWQIQDKEKLNDYYDDFTKEIKRFRCLTVYSGYAGVAGMQEQIALIAKRSLNLQKEKSRIYIPRKKLSERTYYVGLPLLITENDKSRKLFNGDIGLVLKIENELRAVFSIENQLFHFALDTLPPHKEAYVLTVHKSQGSEYDTVFFYLPPENQKDENQTSKRLLTKQILYTGLTRARNQVILAGSIESWKFGIQNQVHRQTGFQWLEEK
ncbi:ATP-dependent DNA helicase [Leptospira idonii]|nr:AAA family ATPase [Leptospira idonii]